MPPALLAALTVTNADVWMSQTDGGGEGAMVDSPEPQTIYYHKHKQSINTMPEVEKCDEELLERSGGDNEFSFDIWQHGCAYPVRDGSYRKTASRT